MRVADIDDAAAWMGDYASWEAKWESFLKQRTYARTGAERPSWAKPNQTWWYTHRALRSVSGFYRQLIRDQSLFTWLEDQFLQDQTRTVARTTSPLEGWPDRAINDLLRHRKGFTGAHARRAVDWLLQTLTEHPPDP